MNATPSWSAESLHFHAGREVQDHRTLQDYVLALRVVVLNLARYHFAITYTHLLIQHCHHEERAMMRDKC